MSIDVPVPVPVPGNSSDTPEEYFENHATGIEAEDDAPPPPAEPWDPDQIRIHTRHLSVRQVVDMIDDGDIDLSPDFQRQYVWKDWQRWGLIESILLGIPMPSFYFNEEANGRMQVVDGVQRLTTIHQFFKGEFELGPVTYLRNVKGSDFDRLDGVFRRRFQQAQVVVHVIDPQTPYRVKFDIFRRINTGGTPLSAQEIRHCMSLDRSRSFLQRLANDPAFVAATDGSLRNHPRMADREVALRACAFRILRVEDYARIQRLDQFLGEVTSQIDSRLSGEQLETLHTDFVRAMKNATVAFGEHAFRKWPLWSDYRPPINRGLVETWGGILADYSEQRVAERKEELAARSRDMMTNDPEFMDSILGSTGDPAKVKVRFAKIQALADAVLG